VPGDLLRQRYQRRLLCKAGHPYDLVIRELHSRNPHLRAALVLGEAQMSVGLGHSVVNLMLSGLPRYSKSVPTLKSPRIARERESKGKGQSPYSLYPRLLMLSSRDANSLAAAASLCDAVRRIARRSSMVCTPRA
jgi:hypothetical protein